MRFTVFTPTYNRKDLLVRLYESLKRQTFTDFEWVIVDDGSSDGTEELISGYISENNRFPIIYKWIENGGKPRAVNFGATLARGDLFIILDSDDYLTDSALEITDRYEKTIPQEQKHTYAGVCGLKGYESGDAIGKSFTSGQYLDCTNLERIKNGILGDKSEAIYTDVIRRYPLPIFEGEKFITESVILDRMAHNGLKFRYFNEITMICEYRADGLSDQGKRLFVSNPKGYGLYLYECGKFRRHGFKQRLRSYASYVNTYRGSLTDKEIAENLKSSVLKVKLVRFCLKILRKGK